VTANTLKIFALAGLLILVPLVAAPARAADSAGIERLATCQDSWFEWKSSDPARLQSFVNRFRADFSPTGDGGAYTPKSSLTMAGLPVTQVYPESVGMGVGFSVIVNATFDTTKATLEKRLGKPIGKCEPPSDNMRSCGLEIGEKKTILLLAEDNPKATKTLIGCYYFYEK
jgi:hypothetical protein